jgi:hypothetical protein
MPIVVSPGPSTNVIAKPAAAVSGSKVHRNAELSKTKPIDADINLAIITFSSYLILLSHLSLITLV